MRPVLLLSLSLAPACAASGGKKSTSTLGCDAISEPATWSGEITVDCGSQVFVDSDLVIAPGTEVYFSPGTRLIVQGSLSARGTADERITFAAADPAVPWGGILFLSTSAANALESADVLDAGAEEGIYDMAAVAVGTDYYGAGAVEIRDCFIDGSATYGLSVSSESELTAFSGNTIAGSAWEPVLVHPEALEPLGEGSSFVGNGADAVLIRDCFFPTGRDVTWPVLDVPYQVTGTINLTGHHTLSAGITIQLEPAGTIRVIGAEGTTPQLTAVGKAESPILFTGLSQEPGSWNSLYFSTEGVTNALEHVRFSYGSGKQNPDDAVGMVAVNPNTGGTEVEIRDCFFDGSAGYGIWLGYNQHYNQDIASANQFSGNLLGDVYAGQ